MTELKTRPTDDDVDEFLGAIADEHRRSDALRLRELLARVTGAPAVMWGSAIVGFGQRRLRYDSGRELDWMVLGFSPRTSAATIYLPESAESSADLLAQLGPHSTRGSCLYLKRIADVDEAVLVELLTRAVERTRTTG